MRSLAFLILLTSPAAADVVVAARTLRPHTMVMEQDVVVKNGSLPGTASDVSQVVGLETRVAVYAGRPIRTGDLSAPAVVERNQIVLLTFSKNGLTIQSEGRSLARAGPGERIRVMNLSSRSTLSGTVQPDGSIVVN
ncbi:MAG: flagellar basal body P-ring formation chaperone FlgA [Thalassovita sp.]